MDAYLKKKNSLISGPPQLEILGPSLRICIRIWTIWTARQPASVGNGYQDDIALADANDEAEVDADATNRQ